MPQKTMLDYKKWQELVESMPEEEQTQTLNRVETLIKIHKRTYDYVVDNDNIVEVMSVFIDLIEQFKDIDLSYIEENVVDNTKAENILNEYMSNCLYMAEMGDCIEEEPQYQVKEYDYYMVDSFQNNETIRLIQSEDLQEIIEYILENYYNYLTNKVNATTKNI